MEECDLEIVSLPCLEFHVIIPLSSIRRSIFILFLELLIPVGLLVAIYGLQQAVAPTNNPIDIPTTFHPSPSLNSLYSSIQCDANLVWYCPHCGSSSTSKGTPISSVCQPRKIAIAPKTTSQPAISTFAANLVSWANSNIEGAKNYSTFVYFNSEDDLVNYIQAPLYSESQNISIISSAIIFNGIYPNWDYVVRMNQTLQQGVTSTDNPPDTSLAYVDIVPKTASSTPSSGTKPYSLQYLDADYFSLTDVINTYITKVTCNTTNTCDANAASIQTVGVADFPSPASITSGFWSSIGFAFALVMIIGIMYPLANIISDLVREKESKIREGMMMMALHGEALWASWILHFLFLFVPLAIILTIIGTKVFQYSSPIYIFFYFILFFLASISYCVFVSVFFNNARTASIIANLVFLGGFFIYVGLASTNPTRSQLLAASLHPSAAFTFGTLAFIEYEGAEIGITQNTWNVSSEYNITFQDTLNMMFIDAIYLGVLAWYFSNIWPSEFGTHKPWYFIFLPSYWCSCFYHRNGARDASSVSDIDVELSDPNVEKVPGTNFFTFLNNFIERNIEIRYFVHSKSE